MSTRIIVGYDGSNSSAAAADWAAGEALARRVPLTLLICHSNRPDLGPAEAKAAELRRLDPQLEYHVEARLGSPKDALVAASADAALLVVGKTGASVAKALLIGSVATAVVRHSKCPVVLVPPDTAGRQDPHVIVVGVDGSPAAHAALDWAVEEGAVHGGEVRIVYAWSYTYTRPVIESVDDHAAARAEARQVLDPIVESAKARAKGCAVSGRLVEGTPVWALLEEAASADLLVVGSRGRGGLRSMLVGSAANAVTERAPCPTVVIHRRASR